MAKLSSGCCNPLVQIYDSSADVSSNSLVIRALPTRVTRLVVMGLTGSQKVPVYRQSDTDPTVWEPYIGDDGNQVYLTATATDIQVEPGIYRVVPDMDTLSGNDPAVHIGVEFCERLGITVTPAYILVQSTPVSTGHAENYASEGYIPVEILRTAECDDPQIFYAGSHKQVPIGTYSLSQIRYEIPDEGQLSTQWAYALNYASDTHIGTSVDTPSTLWDALQNGIREIIVCNKGTSVLLIGPTVARSISVQPGAVMTLPAPMTSEADMKFWTAVTDASYDFTLVPVTRRHWVNNYG